MANSIGSADKQMLKKMAKYDLAIHKLKSILSGVIIAAATCLMALVCIVIINGALDQANRAPYHAMYRGVDNEIKNILQKDVEFESVGLYKSLGSYLYDEKNVNVLYMDSVATSFMGFKLVEGKYPKEKNEVAISKKILEDLYLQIGDQLEVKYIDSFSNEHIKVNYIISGIIENKIQENAKQYTALVSQKYVDSISNQYNKSKEQYNTFTSQTPNTIDILAKLNKSLDRLDEREQKTLLQKKGQDLGLESYNVVLNSMYIEGLVLEPSSVLIIVIFSAFIMFASSFVIYCIFYISIANSVKMYAQLISIGTTQKQLKYYLRIQGRILSFIFIPIGMVLALLIGLIISSNKWILYDLLLTLGSGIMSYVVIKITLIKPAKILTTITPIVAMKCIENPRVIKKNKRRKLHISPLSLAKTNLIRERKKNKIAVISLTVSGAFMIAVTIFISSINIPKMLSQSYPLNEQYQIGIQMDNFYERFPEIIKSNPLTNEIVKEIENITGVDKVIRDLCLVGIISSPVIDYGGENNNEIIYSLSPEFMLNLDEANNELKYTDIKSGEIILNRYKVEKSEYDFKGIESGDVVKFKFRIGKDIIEKEFKVGGFIYSQSAGLFYALPETINSVSPYNNCTHICIICSNDSNTTYIKGKLDHILEQNRNLTIRSYEEQEKSVKGYLNVTMKSIYGVCIFIICFGILNMINLFINSAITRKKEFALLEATGMTNKQLRRMLYFEGIIISAKTVVSSAIIGTGLGVFLCYVAKEVLAMRFIVLNIVIWPTLTFACIIIGIQMLVNYIICIRIEQTSLTVRIKEE